MHNQSTFKILDRDTRTYVKLRMPTKKDRTISITDLRADIYNLLDEVADSGKSIYVKRGDKVLEIKLQDKKKEKNIKDLSKLVPHPGTVAPGVDIDTLSAWDEKEWDEKWDKRFAEYR